ncbi:sensor histidine kinase [Streptomyces sp. MK5]|uniref:sensor histidine kinase n=1 Tax=Streptomyces sp. MK5 TaxID=3064253 RepID=UPI0027411B2A|nr:histidine kinase [Streptomyces sp. MK5]
MTTAKERTGRTERTERAERTARTGLLRRRSRTAEITTPPAGTVLPAHVRTGAPDIPVTSATPALPPGWEPAEGTRTQLPPGRKTADGEKVPQGPPAPDHESRTGAAGENENPAEGEVEAETAAHPPEGLAPEKIQISALQAMCRHVFAFRLAMIALSAPAALVHAAPGLATRLVGAAVVVTFMGSYVLFRDWERFGPLLLRHPTLLALDTLFGSLLLIAAGPDSTLAYVSVCTPLLAGLVYSWRGAAVFASLQSLILLVVYAGDRELHANLAQSALFPGLCLIAGAAGATQRTLLLRFGEATRALTTVQARLAVTEAVGAERARLAREMHDSVAKTLHGVALAADGLAGSAGADRMDPALVKHQAELVARSARRAAAEARELLTDLRREHDPTHGTDVLVELAARTRDFGARTGLPAAYRPTGAPGVPPVPPAVARQILTIASEAMENAHRHAAPTRVDVEAGVHGDLLRISVYDDGRGLPPGTTLEQLRRTGHFGLVGMVERAASVGARIRIGRGSHPKGTEVRVELPVGALTAPPAPPTTAPTTPRT